MRLPLENLKQLSMVGFADFSSCLGNFRVEIRMPQPTDFSNTVQES